MLRSHIAGMFLLGALTLTAQTLTPREIFYGEKPAAAVKPPVKRAPVPQVKPPKPPDPAKTPEPAVDATLASASDTVSFQPTANNPLGLKYGLVKLTSSGKYEQADPDVPFVAGDRIRVQVESNDAGYLYVVIQQSSNGAWQMLYPNEGTGGMGGSNKIEKGHSYQIPSKGNFKFDENAGTEKLFVILSRQPEQDLEKMIYSLQDKPPKAGQVSKPLVASNLQVEDNLVKKMRQTYSRDLLIEKVDDAAPAAQAPKVVAGAPKSEKAYYVVNPANTPEARVVADIPLRHQ